MRHSHPERCESAGAFLSLIPQSWWRSTAYGVPRLGHSHSLQLRLWTSRGRRAEDLPR